MVLPACGLLPAPMAAAAPATMTAEANTAVRADLRDALMPFALLWAGGMDVGIAHGAERWVLAQWYCRPQDLSRVRSRPRSRPRGIDHGHSAPGQRTAKLILPTLDRGFAGEDYGARQMWSRHL